MMFKSKIKRRLAQPSGTLFVGLAVACTLMALPQSWQISMRDAVTALLRPGQRAALQVRDVTASTSAWLTAHFDVTARLTQAEAELKRLRDENERLAAELAIARAEQASLAATEDDATKETDSLLKAHCIPARVLGRQGRAFLARHHLLDVGTGDGVECEDFVVDRPALIDRGQHAPVVAGQLVLAGHRVYGKVVESGKRTSRVCGVCEPGYRDLVAIGSVSGPQGLLEGTGEELAKIRLVEITQPVAVDDLVYTTSGAGVVAVPLVCGRVVRVEQSTGAAHWDIWMEPAVATIPQCVAVLSVQLR